MTVDEAKLAARWRIPVVCQGIRYNRISALAIRYSTEYEILRRGYPPERGEAELEDKNRNSISIAKIKDVEPAAPEEFKRMAERYEATVEKFNME